MEGYNPWASWLRSEPELRSLYEWLDNEGPHKDNGRRWGIWGAITGTSFGLAGGTIGIIAGVMGIDPGQHPTALIVPLAVAGMISLSSAAIIHHRQRKESHEVQRLMADARMFTWQLISARWQGSLKNMLGEDRALALNSGAELALRCKRALRSTAWKAASEGSEYANVRQGVGNAMDIAMARLVAIIGRGASATDPEVQALLTDMAHATDEAVKTASRLEGLPSGPTGSGDLRQALAEMRMLNQAQDEVEERV